MGARLGAVLQAYISQEHLYGPSRAADRGFITVRDVLRVKDLEGEDGCGRVKPLELDKGCGLCDLAQGYIYGVGLLMSAPPHFSCKSTHLY
jgi:hypothetical protein